MDQKITTFIHTRPSRGNPKMTNILPLPCDIMTKFMQGHEHKQGGTFDQDYHPFGHVKQASLHKT